MMQLHLVIMLMSSIEECALINPNPTFYFMDSKERVTKICDVC